MVSFPPVSPAKPYTPPSPHPYVPHAQPISFFSILSPTQYWVRSTNHLAPHYLVPPRLKCKFESQHELQNVQTKSGAHSASYSVGTRGSFSWVKQPRHEVNHSPPSSSRVRNEWSCTTTSHICPSSIDRDNFTYLPTYSVNKLPDADWNGMAEVWVQWHMFMFMLLVIQDITGLPENNN